MAKTTKSNNNSGAQFDVQESAVKGNKDSKNGSKKGSKKVELQPAAQLRSSGKAGLGLPPELYDDQLPEGVGPEYYNG
jgi:hypothetical protein